MHYKIAFQLNYLSYRNFHLLVSFNDKSLAEPSELQPEFEVNKIFSIWFSYESIHLTHDFKVIIFFQEVIFPFILISFLLIIASFLNIISFLPIFVPI